MKIRELLFLLILSTVFFAKPLLLIIDASGSMDEYLPNSTITKMDAAKEAAHELVNNYNDKIALMTYDECDDYGDPYNDGIRVVVAFSDVTAVDRSHLLHQAIDNLEPSGGTPIANAIEEGVVYLQDENINDALMVVITDGEETCGGDVQSAIENALSKGYEVRIIGFGLDEEGEKVLKEEIENAGATYYSAKDPNALKMKLREATGTGGCCCSTALIMLVIGLGLGMAHIKSA